MKDVAEAILRDADPVTGTLGRLDAGDAQAGPMYAMNRWEQVIGMVGKEIDNFAPGDQASLRRELTSGRRSAMRRRAVATA